MLGAVLFPSQDACAAPGDTSDSSLDPQTLGDNRGPGTGAEWGVMSPPAHPLSLGFTKAPWLQG